MGQAISDPAIIVKMIRVMMLAPVLVVLSIVLARRDPSSGANGEKRKITIPWFAFLFLAVIGFNSLHLLPAGLVDAINTLDTFLLTMAMTALGAESSFEKFKKAGARPFLLARLPVYLAFLRRLLAGQADQPLNSKTFLLRKEGNACALPFRTGEKKPFHRQNVRTVSAQVHRLVPS